MENFGVRASEICNNPNLSVALQTACDQGSLSYCADPNNITNVNCKGYLDRVVKSMVAEKTNKPYANPIKVSKGKKTIDYYKSLVESVNSYGNSNIETPEFGELLDIFIKNNIDNMPSEAMVEKARQYCLKPTADSRFCGVTDPNQSWFVKSLSGDGIRHYVKVATDLANKKQTLNIYDDQKLVLLNTKYPNLFKSVETIFLKGLMLDMLSDKRIITIRNISPNLKEGIDTFALTLINANIPVVKSKYTIERLDNKVYGNVYSSTNKALLDIINRDNIESSIDLELKKDADNIKLVIADAQMIYDKVAKISAELPSGVTKNTANAVLHKMKQNLNTIKKLGSSFLNEYAMAMASDDTTQKVTLKYKLLTMNEVLTGSFNVLRRNERTVLSWNTSNSFNNKSIEKFTPYNPFSSVYNWLFPKKTEKLTQMPAVQTIVNNSMIYNPKLRAYAQNIIAHNNANNIQNDPFVRLISSVDNANLDMCTVKNPLTTLICISMLNSPDVNIINKIKDNTKSYCAKNFFDPDCNKYITDNEAIFKNIMHDIQKNAVARCLTPDGKKDLTNCSPYPKLPNSKSWIVDNTKDEVQLNIDGSIKQINSKCGPSLTHTFTKAQCSSICKQYPDLCTKDTQTKCGDLNYRFTQDKFENNVEHYSCNQRGLDNSHLLLLFIFVIFIALIISNKKSCYNIGVFNKHHKLKNN